ncbi:hypothetical protein M0804_004301 [Polistes exclamans]|nr:hypothetical protein M0804_004301 [Polistes exclamans]
MEWGVDEAESLSDHCFIRFQYRHEATGVRSLRPQDKTFPWWNLRVVDTDVLAAAFISGELTRPGNADRSRVLGKWIRETLRSACDMAMPKIIGKKDGQRKVSWRSQELTALRAAATAARRRYLRSRRRGDKGRMELCLDDLRTARKNLKRAIKKAKSLAWREFLATLKLDPWSKPYRLVMENLKPYAAPVTEVLEPDGLCLVLEGLFPLVDQDGSAGGCGVQEDGAAVTTGEVLAAAKGIIIGKAPGLQCPFLPLPSADVGLLSPLLLGLGDPVLA